MTDARRAGQPLLDLHRQLGNRTIAHRSPALFRCGGTPCAAGGCGHEEENRLHRSAAGCATPSSIPAIVGDVLNGPGLPLDAGARLAMEGAFGRDFGGVRVHTDQRAAASARAASALAYTVGKHVVFGSGQYAPESTSGRRLLAHELTHVVQVGDRGSVRTAPRNISEPGEAAEQEAERVADKIAAQGAVGNLETVPLAPGPRGGAGLHRRCLSTQVPDHCNIRRVAPAGVRFHFNVNCDTFKSGEERRLRDFSADPAAVPPGAPIEVTGIASLDGPADFNDALSCQRAEVVAGILREKHAVSLVRGSGGIGALHDADNRAVAVFVRVPLPVSPREQQCTVGPGIPNTSCGAYTAQDWWLPGAYVQNATCACLTTPNVPTANCVRLFLQKRLAATPSSVVRAAAAFKHLDPISVSGAARALVDPTGAEIYEAFVQSTLTPLIYKDHVDAYRSCCCPSGPAVYPSWIGVTTAPLPCSVTGAAIAYFGSCHGTPGTW